MKLFASTVINFHTVYDYQWMDKIFGLLKKHYTMVSMSELEEFYFSGHNINNACHITFDDGHISFYDTVYPLLQKHQIPVSIYVSPAVAREGKNFWFQEIGGYDQQKLLSIAKSRLKLNDSDELGVGSLNALFKSLPLELTLSILELYRVETGTELKQPMNMNVEHLKELYESGYVEIGAHTLNHPILKNETNKIAQSEIADSIIELSNIFDEKVRYFAYPNGNPDLDFGDREMQILAENGIKLAFSTEYRAINSADQPLSVPRKGLTYGSTGFVLFKLMSGNRWMSIKKIMKGQDPESLRKSLREKLNCNVGQTE